MRTSRLQNLIVVCCVFLLLVSSACCGVVYATETISDTDVKYNVVTIVVDGSPVGVKMVGGYFGIGATDVSVEVYDDVDFLWDKPATAKQRQTKQCLTALFDEISQLCDTINNLSNLLYDGKNGVTSDIWRYNNADGGTSLQIDKLTYDMLSVAKKMYNLTDGLFNPALHRLVDLWGFSPRFSDGVYSQSRYAQVYDRVYDYVNGSYPLPADKYVQAFSDSDFVDFSKVQLLQSDDKYYVAKPDVVAVADGIEFTQWLDVGGIAKGFACDKIVEMFNQNNIDGFYVDVGGSSAACGTNYDGGEHLVAVTDPFKSVADVASISMFDKKLSTSGVYRRYYIVDGQRYSHVIDGRTGKPTDGIVYSATIVSGDFTAAEADCLTTALLLLGGEGIADFINDNGEVCVFALVRTTDGNKQLLTNVDDRVVSKGSTFDEYANALQHTDGRFEYVASATVVDGKMTKNTIVTIFCITCGILVIVSVTLSIVLKGNNDKKNVNFKHEPFFCKSDIAVYFAVATCIVVLFVVFAVNPTVDKSMSFVKAVDMVDGTTVFSYDVSRNDWSANSDDWIVEVIETSEKLTVTLRKKSDEQHFNKFEILRGDKLTVRMIDAVCGAHKDCVNNFGAMDAVGQGIVCSPNGLKIVSE